MKNLISRKKLLFATVALILLNLICVNFFGFGYTTNSFSVTVECYDKSTRYFCVSYSKGVFPFIEYGHVQQAFDISSNMEADDWFDYVIFSANDVVHQLYLTRDKGGAIYLGRLMTDYTAVKHWNDSVYASYKRMEVFRDAHPCHVTLKKCADCCTDQKIY